MAPKKKQQQQPAQQQKGRKRPQAKRKQQVDTRWLAVRRGQPQGQQSSPTARKYAKGHPTIPPGTFDGPALLASVLAQVTPMIEEATERIVRSVEDAADDLQQQLLAQAMPLIADAVRSAVVEGMQTRRLHLAQLAVIDRTAWRADRLHDLQKCIDRELAKAGLLRVTDTADLTLFNLDQDGELPHGSTTYELLAPAYVDAESGRVVERGWIRHSDPDEPKGLAPRNPSRSGKQ